MLRLLNFADPLHAERLEHRSSVALLIICTAATVVTFGVLVRIALVEYAGKSKESSVNVADEAYQTDPFLPDRLPGAVSPVNYNLYLEHNATSKTYEGTVSIELSCLNQTRQVVLHIGPSVTVSGITFQGSPSTPYKAVYTRKPSPYELLVVTINGTLQPRHLYNLTLYFSGTMSRFPEVLSQRNGRIDRGLLVTEMSSGRSAVALINEGRALRHVFPCFNHPVHRAAFQLSLNGTRGMVAVSSSEPLEEEGKVRNSLVVIFPRTAPLSPSSFSFFHSDFWSESRQRGVFVWGDRDIADMTYAASIAPQLMSAMTRKFPQWPFPEQVHIVAIRKLRRGLTDWGVLYLRDEDLRLQPTDADGAKLSIALKIARRLADLFWGSVVTTVWWRSNWIVHGIAACLAIDAVAKVNTTWNAAIEVFKLQRLAMMSEDAGGLPHVTDDSKRQYFSEEYLWNRPRQAWGALLFHAYDMYVGQQQFKWELSNFMSKRRFVTLKGELLLDKLGADQLITPPFFRSWTSRHGYPVLHVQQLPNGSILVEQKPYCVDGQHCSSNTTTPPWHIPIFARLLFKNGTSLETGRSQMNTDTRLVDAASPPDFFFLFPGTAIYCRVMYDVAIWKALSTAVLNKKFDLIPEVNRATFLSDLSAFVQSSHVSLALFLNFAAYLFREPSVSVWRVYIQTYATIRRELASQDLVTLQTFNERLCHRSLEDSERNKLAASTLVAIREACCFTNSTYCAGSGS